MTRFEESFRHYKSSMNQIMAAGSSNWGVDPYEWECFTRMTPIESALWAAIREAGIVMYPQFPIGPFFADFCNPVAKVVIECDGAAWHQDKEKDARRQQFIEEQGYTVLRIPGSSAWMSPMRGSSSEVWRLVIEWRLASTTGVWRWITKTPGWLWLVWLTFTSSTRTHCLTVSQGWRLSVPTERKTKPNHWQNGTRLFIR